MVKMGPMNRPVRPEEIAGTALFLAASASDYLIGRVLHVNGGLYM